jgi:hypothetical protein
LRDSRNTRHKHQALLVDGDVLRGSRESFSGHGFNVDDWLAAYSGDLAVNCAGKGRRAESHCGDDGDDNFRFHVFSWFKLMFLCAALVRESASAKPPLNVTGDDGAKLVIPTAPGAVNQLEWRQASHGCTKRRETIGHQSIDPGRLKGSF